MNPIYLDLETTDLDENARIIQLAYKNSDTGDTVNEFFKPPAPISIGAMAVHHVTNEMVADKPVFAESGYKEKLTALLADNILVAHNAPFDMGVLKTEGVETARYIDTLRISHHLVKSESHKLQYLRYLLNLNVEGPAHDALGDIMVLEKLFEKLKTLIKEKFPITSEESVIQKMMTLTKQPVLMDEFRFGKHKGKSFSEVAATDRGYLEWLYKSESQKPEAQQNADLVATIKYYLKIDS